MNSKSLRYLRKISHHYLVVVKFPPSFLSQVFFVSSKQGYSYLKFKGGNVDRNGIYSSPTEVFSNAILFVYPLRGAVAKKCARVMAQFVLTIALLTISIEPAPLVDKVSSYSLLLRLWLLVH